jgi:hypothetical protein
VSLEEDPADHDIDVFVDALQNQDEFLDCSQTSLLPEPPSVFSFSHVPPSWVLGCRQWPGRGESQSHLDSYRSLTLHDVWVHLQAFLDSSARLAVSTLAPSFSYGVLCSPMWITRPWKPYRRRRWGFGRISSDRSVTTDRPTLFHIFHHLWPFFTARDRWSSQRASPHLLRYSFQCLHAATTSVAVLRAPRAPPCKPKLIDCARTRLFGSALLRFDFIYGDMVRWLSGEYTNRHRDWQHTFHAL